MNRTALVARAMSRFRDSDGAVVNEDAWIDYLDDAYMEVAAAHPLWPWMENRATVALAAGDAEAILPENVFSVTAVHNVTDDFPLVPIDGRSAYRHMFPDPTILGNPQYYRLKRNKLEVYPRPSVPVTLEADLITPPAALDAELSEPVFPEQYHRILVSGALRNAYEDQGNAEASAIHGKAFDTALGRMVNDLLGTRTEYYPVPQEAW